MEPTIPESNNQPLKFTDTSRLFCVTKTSKYLAMALFIILPFQGAYLGYVNAPERVVEVERVVERGVMQDEVVVNDEEVSDDGDLEVWKDITNSFIILQTSSSTYEEHTLLKGDVVSDSLQLSPDEKFLLFAGATCDMVRGGHCWPLLYVYSFETRSSEMVGFVGDENTPYVQASDLTFWRDPYSQYGKHSGWSVDGRLQYVVSYEGVDYAYSSASTEEPWILELE